MAGAMFELPARGRVVVSNSEFRVLGERLARLAIESTPVASEGARLVGEWIEAVQSGEWDGPIPLRGRTAEAVHLVLAPLAPASPDGTGLSALHAAVLDYIAPSSQGSRPGSSPAAAASSRSR